MDLGWEMVAGVWTLRTPSLKLTESKLTSELGQTLHRGHVTSGRLYYTHTTVGLMVVLNPSFPQLPTD